MIFDDDQIALRDVARRFAREKLRPDYQKRESQPGIDRALFREMGSLGLIGVDLSEEYGGLGLSGVTAGMITEEIAYGDFNVSYMQLLSSLMGAIIHANASPELARTWNSRIVAGEAIVALGLTEPRGGSDAANLQLKARRVGDEYILSGEKTSITFADQADAMVLFARTGKPEDGARGITALLVDLNQKGVQRTRFNDVGSKIIGRGSVFFDDVRVPADHLLGERGRGYAQFLRILDEGRIAIAALAVGLSQGCVDESVQYANTRQAFGRTIGNNQSIAFKIADMETRTHIGRLSYYEEGARLLAGEPFKHEAAIAKLFTTEAAVTNAREATQIFGGYGFMNEYPVARFWRDSKVLEIGEGTSEVQRMLIARQLGVN